MPERRFSVGPEAESVSLTTHPRVSERSYSSGGFCCAETKRYLCLEQDFVVVRHSTRLDHTKEWENYPHKDRKPHDSPLTNAGKQKAAKTGESILERYPKGHPFELIWSSPYYRCVQTAAEIAKKLKLKVCLDLDIGEIFDDVYMPKNVNGEPMHRTPEELTQLMAEEYPDVLFARDADGQIAIHGYQQDWPEDFFHAQIRYAAKFEEIAEHATDKLMSVVIVTHADAIPVLTDFLRHPWRAHVEKVPYCGYIIASRTIAVSDAAGEIMISNPHALDTRTWEGDKDDTGHLWKVKGCNGVTFASGVRGVRAGARSTEQISKEMAKVAESLDHSDFHRKASDWLDRDSTLAEGRDSFAGRDSTADDEGRSSERESRSTSGPNIREHLKSNAIALKSDGSLKPKRWSDEQTSAEMEDVQEKEDAKGNRRISMYA
eukprot:gnl/TRDRNA2_/TRDRNA2_85222_c0_seq1.p1 gnl/TRDRNA2_/TRDRNA2_85222_c0~~gnl/TRDRNA2_/TRDRNA2_85222_c0_seq1.p1  ORF type:complete len:432 (-),score=69.27 gnl/TRDRNA2_/TRDRNA2_85222_c0_seq1:126-1421(-)